MTVEFTDKNLIFHFYFFVEVYYRLNILYTTGYFPATTLTVLGPLSADIPVTASGSQDYSCDASPRLAINTASSRLAIILLLRPSY